MTIPSDAPEAPRKLPDRTVMLERLAVSEGQTWATLTREQVHSEQRRAAGGWPGTLSEARARVAFMVPNLAERGLRPMTTGEREHAAKVIYATARSAWLERREAEDDSALTALL
jgi:hypothetical protein